MDAEFQKALDIGVSNQRVVELAQNWCGHLVCEKFGGTGLIEVQTGLPIGMRRFRCPHASCALSGAAPSDSAGNIHLRENAAYFVRRLSLLRLNWFLSGTPLLSHEQPPAPASITASCN
jgi:hypothetical protein